MSKVRNQFPTEFKQECVNLVVNQGYSVAQAASAMHVGFSSMQPGLANINKNYVALRH